MLFGVCLLASVVSSTPCRAQDENAQARLSVRPHVIATGTRNATAGARILPELDSAIIYVPPKAVGTRHVPLLVVVHGGGGSARYILETQRQFADQYGMILVAPNSPGGHWADYAAATASVDSALKIALHDYAVDPDKIGITGMSEGGAVTLWLGRNNLDVFSRVAPESPVSDQTGGGPQNTTTQFLSVAGLGEEGPMWSSMFDVAQEERKAGRIAEVAMVLRPHQRRVQDEAMIWRWFHDSWATPGKPVLTAPEADSTLVLTTDGFDQLNAFWNRFMDEPMAIRDAGHKHPVFLNVDVSDVQLYGLPPRMENANLTLPDTVSPNGRRSHQKWVRILVGREYVSVQLMDIVALAATHKSVANDLRAAGITAAKAEAMRTALLSALATIKTPENKAGVVVPGSALEKNVAFVQSYKAEMDALQQVGMWDIP